MNFLPVLGRELRVTARGGRLYWGRFAAALLAILVIAWFWLTMGPGGSSAGRAQDIFGALATLAFIYALLLGGYVTSDSISEEKREGTLGLLFLTNLRSYDVVAGKTAAGSLRAFYTLIAIFPVLTIPVLLGGITGAMIFRMTLALANTLFFTLCVGLFVSACSTHDRKAQAGAFVTILVFTLGWPALIAVLNNEFQWKLHDGWYGLSPGAAFITSFDTVFAKQSRLFWTALAIPHVLAWVAFAGAALVVRRVWQDRPAGAGGGWRGRIRGLARGSAEARLNYRRRLLGITPYFWLAARDRWKPIYVGIFLGGCAFFWMLLWSYNRRDMLEQEAFFMTAVILHLSLKLWLATEAGRQLYDDRRNSGLELTLSTPLSVREILEGQFLALLRQFGWAIGLVLLLDVGAMIAGARARLYGAENEMLLAWIAIMGALLADAGAIAAVGMWLGLTSRRSSRAAVQTLGYVLILPWLILFAMFTYLAIVNFSRLDTPNFFIGSYLAVSVLTDAALFIWASSNLIRRFRQVAVQSFAARPGRPC